MGNRYVLFGRHVQAVVNWEDRIESLLYCLGLSDPRLSVEGIKYAIRLKSRIYNILCAQSLVGFTSRTKRGKETLEILTMDLSPPLLIVENSMLDPVDYDDVPPRLIHESIAINDDAIVYPKWIGTEGFHNSWGEARAIAQVIKSGNYHVDHNVDWLMMISHCDKAAMILCALAGDGPKNFADHLIARGEFVQITISDSGEIISIKKVISKQAS